MFEAGINIFGDDDYIILRKPSAYDSVIQWLSHYEKIYRDENGNSFFPDKKGDQLRDVQLGSLIRFNGINNTLTLVSNTSGMTNEYVSLEVCCPSDASIFLYDSSDSSKWVLLSQEGSGSLGLSSLGVAVDSPNLTVSIDKNAISASATREDIFNIFNNTDIHLVEISRLNMSTWGDVSIGRYVGFEQSALYTSIEIKSHLTYNFEDSPAGSTLATFLDSSGVGLIPNANHGTLNGTIDGDTRQESIEVSSDKNLIGYTQDGLNYIPLLNTPENRALPLSQQRDVNGDIAQYTGRAKYPLQIVNNNIAVSDGTHFIDFTDLSGVTIVEYGGTAVPSKNVNNIEWTAGTMFYIELSNGIFIPFCAGDGVEVFDTKNGVQYLISGPTASLWDKSNTVETFNQIEGCDVWELDASPGTFKYVTFKQNGTSILTDGDTLTGYTWISRHRGSEFKMNGSENTFLQLAAPEIRESEETYFDTRIFYDVDGIPIPIEHSDIVADYENKGVWTTDITSRAPLYSNWVLRNKPFHAPWIDLEAWVDSEDYND